MRFERRHTEKGRDPFSSIAFRSATSEIKNPDGTIVFRAENRGLPPVIKDLRIIALSV